MLVPSSPDAEERPGVPLFLIVPCSALANISALVSGGLSVLATAVFSDTVGKLRTRSGVGSKEADKDGLLNDCSSTVTLRVAMFSGQGEALLADLSVVNDCVSSLANGALNISSLLDTDPRLSADA